jgi:hypothetical protein
MNGLGILLDDVSGEVTDGEAEGLRVHLNAEGASSETDGAGRSGRRDGNGVATVFGGDRP